MFDMSLLKCLHCDHYSNEVIEWLTTIIENCFQLFREHKSALRERERKHRQAIAAAKRNREQASKFLKETMSRYTIEMFISEGSHA